MKSKGGKYHLYAADKGDGCGKTACGRDGKKVGGLISYFFAWGGFDKDSCKTCAKIYKKRLI